MQSGVYQITNQVNGKRYIGSAVNLRKRKSQHFRFLKNGNHPNIHLRRSSEIHGVEFFTFKEIVSCDSKNIIHWEQIAIDALKPEYNICPVAGNTSGRKFSEETKKKISNSHKGRKHPYRSESWRQNISESLKGKKKSDTHMQSLQKGRAERVYTKEQKLKLSNYLKCQYENGMRSRERSLEYRNKIAKTLSVLTDDQVREIRQLIKSKELTYLEMSKIYKVSTSVFCDIKNGKTYKWVH
jgi:group I intron endonuclease